ncbi:hypothetical protein GCM10010988_08690 [Cnuibacter physcomitrellae]|uniref:Prepilin type IV endopeptidase peptidase domain-containing protein n=1 Tax=Cnuibacter physcomitrellae TaxID=1619308 RepID=A0A1X9LP57_9MICO|nr:prepilin peptidase [Cnuibacter physcomitrellae]ARJ05741.1 hypothetical protein B5808_11290 [Cnuibacter physcomitrellae]GGI36386.1 hypothetical protein GCM10010988_08690 [Cnuibacter physcomitrellae]
MRFLLPLLGLVTVATRGAEAGVLPGLWFAATGWRLAITDLGERRLPNALTLPGLVLAAAAACRDPPAGVWMLGTAAVLSLSWWVGAVGMGDVKLGVGLAGAVVLLGGASAALTAGAVGVLLCGALAVDAIRSGDRHLPLGPPMLLAAWAGTIVAPG